MVGRLKQATRGNSNIVLNPVKFNFPKLVRLCFLEISKTLNLDVNRLQFRIFLAFISVYYLLLCMGRMNVQIARSLV